MGGKKIVNKQIIEQRTRKANDIIKLYENREYRQEDVARELGIPKSVVAKVTKEFNYEHGKQKNSKNLNDNQKINPVIDYNNMDYLDQYEF